MALARALASAGAGVDGEEGSQYFTGVLSDPHNAVYWTSSCAAVAMGMRHIAMSQFRACECDACANEWVHVRAKRKCPFGCDKEIVFTCKATRS